jgi:hypothetical protein
VQGTLESYEASLELDQTSSSLKPFNAAVALSKTMQKESSETADDGLEVPDMATHLLVNRAATFTLKYMVSGCKKMEGKGEGEEKKSVSGHGRQLAESVAGTVDCGYWVKKCVEDPWKMQAPAFVLLAVCETLNDGTESGKNILSGFVKGVEVEKMLQKVQSVARIVEENGTEVKKRKISGGGAAKKKLKEAIKRGEVVGKTAAVSGIETFLLFLLQRK